MVEHTWPHLVGDFRQLLGSEIKAARVAMRIRVNSISAVDLLLLFTGHRILCPSYLSKLSCHTFHKCVECPGSGEKAMTENGNLTLSQIERRTVVLVEGENTNFEIEAPTGNRFTNEIVRKPIVVDDNIQINTRALSLIYDQRITDASAARLLALSVF